MTELLLAALVAAGPLQDPEPFDPRRYPPQSIGDLIKANPCGPSKDGFELKDLMFSITGTYHETLRPTTKPRQELIRRWAVKLQAQDQADQFDQELRLGDDRTSWWVQVASTTMTHMREELRDGDSTTFYMTYVGCAQGQPILAIEEFATPDYDDLEDDAESYIT